MIQRFKDWLGAGQEVIATDYCIHMPPNPYHKIYPDPDFHRILEPRPGNLVDEALMGSKERFDSNPKDANQLLHQQLHGGDHSEIEQALAQAHLVDKIDLSGQRLCDEQQIYPLIKRLESIRAVHLARSKAMTVDQIGVSNHCLLALAQHPPTLRELYTERISPHCLLQCCTQQSNLQHLELGADSQLDDTHLSSLAKELHHLRFLSLGGLERVKGPGLTALLAANPHLLALQLESLGDRGRDDLYGHPSLRTVRALLTHTALQLIGSI